MSAKILKDSRTISLALLSTLLVAVAATGGTEPQIVTSQNATSTGPANQTSGATTQNQTGTAPANLTRFDFGPVTSALNSARQSIYENLTQDAYFSLSYADNALFRTALQEGPSATATVIVMSEPIRNHIENARQALFAGDVANALKELNSADLELVKITLGLPAGEEEPAAVEEEPPAEEEEPPAEEG
jgi:hypothetical protein